VTQTIDPTIAAPAVADRPGPTNAIIADFRATMTQLKCASSERLLRLGVSMAQLHIMFTLQRSGEMTMSRLADVLNVSDSNATGLIDRLEERGFIERQRVSTDRRVVLVRVTPDGEAMLREVDALSDELLRSVLTRLPASQLRGVAAAIAALREAVDSTVESTTTPTADRHVASTTPPRSAANLRDADLATQHGRK
jgi:DNA-binding MarR family transcriptional regulator